MSKFINSYIYDNLLETLIWEYYTEKETAIYKVDRGITSELSFELSSRKVSEIFDQTLSRLNDYQSNANNQPILSSDNERVNKRYYLKFNGAQRMFK